MVAAAAGERLTIILYMILLEYEVWTHVVHRTGRSQVIEYVRRLPKRDRAKIHTYIRMLRERQGYLGEPYARHIIGSIRELRVDFGRTRHRVFFFTHIKRRIVLLSAFTKDTPKTPVREIERAQDAFQDVINNHAYEKASEDGQF
ncbi:MAG: hypothetical protein RLZZ324_705 [Candidatus Parcubacteria bacterium]|jgi:phage-related protein